MNSREYRVPRAHGPKVAVIGGGHGLATMLRGLKQYTENISAIVTVADDGGGSGMLRQDLGMPPPGDMRNCMEALANTEPVMRELLHYRFTEGSLAGQSFGNLFLAALNGISPSFDVAVSRMSEVLAVTGRVLPVTTADVQLEAEFENGATVVGESKIFYCKKQEDCRIRQVRLIPAHPKALPAALSAIADAESFRQELEKNEALYREVTGQEMPKLYRPPQGKFCESNLRMAQQLGYRTVFWSLAYVDWYQDEQPTPEQAFEKLVPRVHPGAVVLLHSTSSTNAAILDELLTRWEELGYSFGRLEEITL